MSKSKMVLQLYATFVFILFGFALGLVAEFPENLRPSRNILCYTDGHTLAKDLDLRYCSHIVVSLPSNITHHNGSVVLDKAVNDLFQSFAFNESSHLKRILSLDLLTEDFSTNLSSQLIISNVVQFIDDLLIEGVEINWQKPSINENSKKDRESFSFFMKELSANLREKETPFPYSKHSDVTSRTNDELDTVRPSIFLRIPTSPELIVKGYDLKLLARTVDLFIANTHNMADSNNVTYHPSRLMGLSDILNTDSVLDLIVRLGVPEQNIVAGVPAFATQFLLRDVNQNIPGSFVGQESIQISKKKLCSTLSQRNWTVERDEDLTGTYAYSDIGDWIAFDDELASQIKAKYFLIRGIAGVAVMTVRDTDDQATITYDCLGKPTEQIYFEQFAEQESGERTRRQLATSLQNDLSSTSSTLRSNLYNDRIKPSPYRIVRIVGRSGETSVMRQSLESSLQCSRQGYYRHPENCGRFYRCVKFDQYVDDFTVFEYDCPEGLVFDDRWEVCTWPSQTSPCGGSSEIRPVPMNRFVCPSEGYFADPENCRWFFACRNHALDGTTFTQYEFRCPFGLLFDEKNLICNWPWLVPQCSSSGSLPKSSSSLSESTLPSQGIEKKILPESVPIGSPGYLSGKLVTGEGLYQDPRPTTYVQQTKTSPTDCINCDSSGSAGISIREPAPNSGKQLKTVMAIPATTIVGETEPVRIIIAVPAESSSDIQYNAQVVIPSSSYDKNTKPITEQHESHLLSTQRHPSHTYKPASLEGDPKMSSIGANNDQFLSIDNISSGSLGSSDSSSGSNVGLNGGSLGGDEDSKSYEGPSTSSYKSLLVPSDVKKETYTSISDTQESTRTPELTGTTGLPVILEYTPTTAPKKISSLNQEYGTLEQQQYKPNIHSNKEALDSIVKPTRLENNSHEKLSSIQVQPKGEEPSEDFFQGYTRSPANQPSSATTLSLPASSYNPLQSSWAGTNEDSRGYNRESGYNTGSDPVRIDQAYTSSYGTTLPVEEPSKGTYEKSQATYQPELTSTTSRYIYETRPTQKPYYDVYDENTFTELSGYRESPYSTETVPSKTSHTLVGSYQTKPISSELVDKYSSSTTEKNKPYPIASNNYTKISPTSVPSTSPQHYLDTTSPSTKSSVNSQTNFYPEPSPYSTIKYSKIEDSDRKLSDSSLSFETHSNSETTRTKGISSPPYDQYPSPPSSEIKSMRKTVEESASTNTMDTQTVVSHQQQSTGNNGYVPKETNNQKHDSSSIMNREFNDSAINYHTRLVEEIADKVDQSSVQESVPLPQGGSKEAQGSRQSGILNDNRKSKEMDGETKIEGINRYSIPAGNERVQSAGGRGVAGRVKSDGRAGSVAGTRGVGGTRGFGETKGTGGVGGTSRKYYEGTSAIGVTGYDGPDYDPSWDGPRKPADSKIKSKVFSTTTRTPKYEEDIRVGNREFGLKESSKMKPQSKGSRVVTEKNGRVGESKTSNRYNFENNKSSYSKAVNAGLRGSAGDETSTQRGQNDKKSLRTVEGELPYSSKSNSQSPHGHYNSGKSASSISSNRNLKPSQGSSIRGKAGSSIESNQRITVKVPSTNKAVLLEKWGSKNIVDSVGSLSDNRELAATDSSDSSVLQTGADESKKELITESDKKKHGNEPSDSSWSKSSSGVKFSRNLTDSNTENKSSVNLTVTPTDKALLSNKVQPQFGQRYLEKITSAQALEKNETLSSEICVRAGLFRHPYDCQKFYECYWDRWIHQFTLHIFKCPVHLIYDDYITACNWPLDGPACVPHEAVKIYNHQLPETLL